MTYLKTHSTLFIGLAVVIVLGVGYLLFFDTPAAPPLSATAAASTAAENQFAALVTQLASVTFDTRIFSDPRFTGLTDLTTPITPEASGRTDPFAPLAGVSVGGP
jgi:hypothetical protein